MRTTWRTILALFLLLALWTPPVQADTAPPQPDAQLYLPSMISSDGQHEQPLRTDPVAVTPAESNANWKPVSTFVHLHKVIAGDGGADDYFGRAMATDGERLVVGAPGDTVAGDAKRGSVYVYVRTEEAWTLEDKLTANDGAAGDEFGGAVAISGNTIVVGAALRNEKSDVDQGAAYVFVSSSSG